MPNKKGNKVLRSGMNAGRQKPMPKMNASRQKSVQPQLVRNIRTGEVAQYIPDKLQPSIPKGWVPTNSSRRGAANASAGRRSNAFVKDGSLIVQRRGNEYRILNSSRKVVAKGRLNSGRQSMNCDVNDYYGDYDDGYYDDVNDYYDTRYSRGRGRDRFNSEMESLWKNEGWADSGMSLDDYRGYAETFIAETGWYPLRLVRRPLLEDSEVIAGDYDETWEPLNDEGYPAYRSFPFSTGSDGVYDYYGLDSSRQSMNCHQHMSRDEIIAEMSEYYTPQEAAGMISEVEDAFGGVVIALTDEDDLNRYDGEFWMELPDGKVVMICSGSGYWYRQDDPSQRVVAAGHYDTY